MKMRLSRLMLAAAVLSPLVLMADVTPEVNPPMPRPPMPAPQPITPPPRPIPHPTPAPVHPTPQPTPPVAELPPDAFGHANEPLPAGAQRVSPEEFNRLKATRHFKLLNKVQSAADEKADQANQLRRKQAIDKLLGQHHELANRVNPAIDTDRVKPTGDGNFSMPVNPNCTNPNSCPHVITLGNASRHQGIAHSVLNYSEKNNQLAAYNLLYTKILQFNAEHPQQAIRAIGNTPIEKFANPAAVAQMNDADRAKAVAVFHDSKSVISIAAKLGSYVSNLPVNHVLSCQGDLGRGNDGDRLVPDGSNAHDDVAATNACAKFANDGVMATFNFPMKPYLTCVKNQQSRGTCWAFSINSMLEAAYARDHKQGNQPTFMNLSEQDLTNMVKLVWFPTTTSYGDDAGPDVLSKMVTEKYRVPYENTWNYNQSRNRQGDDTKKDYTHSCDSYKETCSDSNHQGQLSCVQMGAANYCGYSSPVVNESAGIMPTASSQIWNTDDPDTTMAMTVLALIFNSPLQIGFDVYPEFDNASWSNHGWVKPPSGDPSEKSRGGHYVHIVGYISNEVIAATPAMSMHVHDATTGGGYFIIKNSWGTCVGDGGYYYAPISWMQKRGWSMVVLGDEK